MTATDNSYVASGVGTYGDFIASPGKASSPLPRKPASALAAYSAAGIGAFKA